MTHESIERIACRLALASLAPLLPLEIQPSDLFPRFYELCQDQQRRLDNRLAVCPVPLWVVALLNHYGYVVDLDSAVITGWPRPLPDWLPIDTDMAGRIVRWPIEKPTSLSVQSAQSARRQLALTDAGLTQAEYRVLRALLIDVGQQRKEIARRLGVSVRTIDTQFGSIYRKCGVLSKTELVTKAYREGWVMS